MTEIHAFDPDGTPSPGAQAALDEATEGLPSHTDIADAIAAIPDATTSERGLMPAEARASLEAVAEVAARQGVENTFLGEQAGAEGSPDSTQAESGSAGGYLNTFVGGGAGRTNGRGWKNTAIGSYAMRDNIDGYNNVAVGDSALERNKGGVGSGSSSANDPGARNVAVGSYALRYNQTGRGNVGVGRNAAHTNVSGGYNVAIGTNAYSGSWDENGQQDTKQASYNVAVGYNALFKGNGNSNVAVGDAALYSATTAVEQTAVGSQAARDVTTGTYNVAVGARALLTQTTGGSNVAVGTGSAANLSTGSRNTAVGTSAMNAMTGGGSNTAVGFSAGTSDASPNYTTALGTSATPVGNNSTAIGYNATTTGQNQVQLGNSNTTTYVYGTVQNRSDLRDKADVRDTVLGLDFIESLRPVDYRWDMRDDYEDGTPDGTHKRARFHHGVIAQEVQALDAGFGGVQDHSVNGGRDVLTVGYDEFIAPLIKAVQELSARVTELEGKLDA